MPETIELKVTTLPADELAEARARAEAVVRQKQFTEEWQRMDRFERCLAELPQIEEMPLTHTFTPVPGHPALWLYTRRIHIPAGSLLTTRVHLYEHPFLMLSGLCEVWNDKEKVWDVIRAGTVMVTKAGTRRLMHVIDESIIATCHVTPSRDPNDIVDNYITYDHRKLGHLSDLPPERLDLLLSHAREKNNKLQ